jgi:hypothetical protein
VSNNRRVAALAVVLGFTASAQTPFNALCTERHGIVVGWFGPERATRKQAEADCKKHLEEFKSHDCTVSD